MAGVIEDQLAALLMMAFNLLSIAVGLVVDSINAIVPLALIAKFAATTIFKIIITSFSQSS